MVNAAVLLIAYNRKQNVERVLEVLRKAGVRKLYVSCDGAKDIPEDRLKVANTRQTITDSIDWDCNVKFRFSDENQGCKYGPINAINWIFESEESAIILEDDIVPEQCFFMFCEQLLERYLHDSQVMMISGCNIMSKTTSAKESYFFEPLATTWGWATWKRAWQSYDVSMQGWKELKHRKVLRKLFLKDTAYSLSRDFDSVYETDFDAWDYQWQYSMVKNRGYGIVPKYCMVQNIGFSDEEATHTDGAMFIYQSFEMPFPLVHPQAMTGNRQYEAYVEKYIYHVNYFHVFLKRLLPNSIVRRIRSFRRQMGCRLK